MTTRVSNSLCPPMAVQQHGDARKESLLGGIPWALCSQLSRSGKWKQGHKLRSSQKLRLLCSTFILKIRERNWLHILWKVVKGKFLMWRLFTEVLFVFISCWQKELRQWRKAGRRWLFWDPWPACHQPGAHRHAGTATSCSRGLPLHPRSWCTPSDNYTP